MSKIFHAINLDELTIPECKCCGSPEGYFCSEDHYDCMECCLHIQKALRVAKQAQARRIFKLKSSFSPEDIEKFQKAIGVSLKKNRPDLSGALSLAQNGEVTLADE